ncbi:MAG: peptidase M61, partial [Gammaproteobacteria bacterium]
MGEQTGCEFFHVWNVERMRPEAIYYPDYSKENYTTTMWIYEGITSYYTGVTLVRTHLFKKKKYFENWARTL